MNLFNMLRLLDPIVCNPFKLFIGLSIIDYSLVCAKEDIKVYLVECFHI